MTASTVAVTLLWIAVVAQFPSQRHAPTRLAVWGTMLLLAAIGTLDLTAIGARLDAACGLPNMADLTQHVLAIIAATLARYSAVAIFGAPKQRVRWSRARASAAARGHRRLPHRPIRGVPGPHQAHERRAVRRLPHAVRGPPGSHRLLGDLRRLPRHHIRHHRPARLAVRAHRRPLPARQRPAAARRRDGGRAGLSSATAAVWSPRAPARGPGGRSSAPRPPSSRRFSAR